MNANELLGVEVTKNATLLQEYMNLLQLVARLKAGQVDLADVELVPPNGWKINPPSEPKTEPTSG